MATYKDMIELIGKFKHVPEVLANPSTAYNKFNYGGSIPKYIQGGPVNRNITNTSNPFSNSTSTSIPTSTTSTPMSSTSSTPAPPAPPAGKTTVTNPISQSNLTSAGAPNSGMQSSSSGGGGGGGGGFNLDPVGVNQWFTSGTTGTQGGQQPNPYNTTMNSNSGNLLSGDYGGDKYSPEGMASGAGGGYAGLTPYGDGSQIMNNALISPKVSSFKKGGRMYFDGGKKKAEKVEDFKYTSFDKLTTSQQESLLAHFTSTEGYVPNGHIVTEGSGITFGSGLDAKALITEQDFIDHGVSAVDAKTIVSGLKYTKTNGDVYDMAGKSSLEIQTALGLTEEELKTHVSTIKFTDTTQKDIVSKSVDKMYTNNTDLFDKTSNFEDFTSLSSIVHFTGDSHFESGAINRNTDGDTKRAVQITMYELMEKTDGKLTSEEYNSVLQQTGKIVNDQGGIGVRTETSHPGDASATFNRWEKELVYSNNTLPEGNVYDETKHFSLNPEDYGEKGSSDEKFTTIYDATFVETDGAEGTNVTPTEDTNVNKNPADLSNPYTLNSSSDLNVNGNTSDFNSNTNVVSNGEETDIQMNQTMLNGQEVTSQQNTGIYNDNTATQEIQETGQPTSTVEVGPFLKYGGKLNPTPYEDGGKKEKKKIKYSKNAGSRTRGAFPSMRNEDIINADLNKDGFIAVSMAREYGYTGEINMTSGERLSKDQWRVMMQNQYPQDMHLYSRNFRGAVNDSINTHGYNTEASNEQIIGWIDSQYDLYVAGELDESDLPSQHMIGNAGDFTGSFKKWLSSSKSKEYRKAFGLGVLNESDHFHVKFNDINVDNFDVSKKADYSNYENMFNQLAVENEKGELRISMNPLDHDENVMYNMQTAIENKDVQFPEVPAPELSTATPPPGYEDYQKYRNEEKEKQEKTFGYQVNEKMGNMENYSPKKPILSYEEWGVENNIDMNNNTEPVLQSNNTNQQTVPMPTQGTPMVQNNLMQNQNPYDIEGFGNNILNAYNPNNQQGPTLDKMIPQGAQVTPSTLPQLNNSKIPTQEQYGQLIYKQEVDTTVNSIFNMINPYGN